MKKKLVVVGIAVLLVVAAAYFIWPEKFGLCETRATTIGEICSSPLSYPYGVGLLPFSIALLGLSIVGLATLRKTFWWWIKFSIGYFILTLLFFFMIENSSYGMAGISFGFGNVSAWAPALSVLYAILSLVIMSISELLGRGKKV